MLIDCHRQPFLAQTISTRSVGFRSPGEICKARCIIRTCRATHILGHFGEFFVEHLLQGTTHQHDVLKIVLVANSTRVRFQYLARFIVQVTIGEHQVQVGNTFFDTVVVVGFQTFFDGAKIHGVAHDLVVILNDEMSLHTLEQCIGSAYG